MGFFKTLTDGVSKALDVGSSGGGGSSWANGLIDIGTTVADTALGLYSNRETQKANERAARDISDAYSRNAEATEAANLAAQERFERLAADGQPGVTYLKRVASSDPYDMTPGQRQSLEEMRRETVNTLARSGLRGSGRAMTAALKEVDSDARNNFINANLARTDQAAGRLSNIATSSNRAAADYGVDAARHGTGNMASAAEVSGSADIANQQVGNSGLADVNSAIASLVKEGRKSRYFTDRNEQEVI